MTLKLIDFTMEHVDQIEKRPVFHEAPLLKENIASLMKIKGSYLTTITQGGDVVAIVGLVEIRRGVAEVWSITSDQIKECAVSFHKLILFLLDYFEKERSLHRIQMTVKEDYPQGQRWAKSLGFIKEGLLHKYDINGDNHILYARFKSDG